MPNTNHVDERIVEMRIDNEKFEAGARKTLRILESLDEGLKGIGSQNADGFDKVGDSLEKVTDRFSTFGIVGDQVIRNLTNKAMELVGQIRNMSTMLTTQQVGAGWNKYAEKVEAVQTIMASTNNLVGEGLTWADQEEQIKGVNEQLERLTWFADETSYSFTDMVNNVGKFTAAGRELEESVTAMQGISAWAAISGGKPSEAGRAMYNLSQALGLGAVTAIDWKSIELANMATYEFKKQAIDTAVELGKLKKVSDGVWETVEGGFEVTVEKFRDTLTFGRGEDKINWFDSDVLLSVLNRYGDFAQRVKEIQDDFAYDSATNVLGDLKLYESALSGDSRAAYELQRHVDSLGISFDELAEKFDVMLGPEYDLGRRAFQAAQEAKTFQEAIDATRDAVSTKWMDIFEMLFGNYLQAKELWTDLAETLWDVFAGPVDRLKEIFEYGFGGRDGLFGQVLGNATGGTVKAAKNTETLEAKLSKLGKTMDDLDQGFRKTLSAGKLVDILNKYESIGDALKNGAFSADEFKLALGAMDEEFDQAKTVSLNRALAKSGKTMKDFEKAVRSVAEPQDLVNMLGPYASIEDAFRNGAISAELFKKALESLGIESENVVAEVEETTTAAAGSLSDLREVALGILRGDYDNGEERRRLLEEMGLDWELMQAMAGDLKNYGYYITDEALMEYMEQYYQAKNLGARLGYDTFAEYIGTLSSEVEELYTMDSMLNEADDLLASIYGNGIFAEDGELLTGGDLFRKGLTNIMTFIDDVATAISDALLKVFGGSDDAQKAIQNLGGRFYDLAARFYNFTESIQLVQDVLDENGNVIEQDTSRLDRLTNVITAIAAPIRFIGKLLGIVFSIARHGLGLAMKLLSPILSLVTSLFTILSGGLDYLVSAVKNSPVLVTLSDFGTTIVTSILTPLEKIGFVVRTLISLFREGFEADGIQGAFQKVSEGMDTLFQNHPTFLKIFHAMEKVAKFFANALETVGNALLLIGGIIGGAFYAVYAGISWLFQQIADGVGIIAELISNSKTLNQVFGSISGAFLKFGNVIRRVAGYAREGFEEGGIGGAFTAVFESFQRGVQRLGPYADRFVESFTNIKNTIVAFLSNIWASITGFKIDTTQIEQKFQNVTNIFNNVVNGIFGTEAEREETKAKVEAFVLSVWEGFLAGLNKIKLSDVLGALRLGILASVAGEIMSAISVFKQLERSLKDIPETFQWVLEDIGLAFKSLAVGFQANVILKIAVAIGAIAGAILLLSFIPEEKLNRAFAVVAVLMAILALIAKYTSKMKVLESGLGGINIQNFQVIPEIAGILVGLGILIGSIAAAVTTLAIVSKLGGDLWNIAQFGAAVIGGLVLFVSIIFDHLKRFTPKQITALGKMLLSMTTGLMLVSLAIQMLVIPIAALTVLQYLGVGKFRRAVLAVGVILGIMAALVGLFVGQLSKIRDSSGTMLGNSAEQLRQVGNTLLKAAGAMAIVAAAITLLAVPIIALTAAQFLGGGKFLWAVVSVIALIGVISVLVGTFVSELSKIPGSAQLRQIGNTLLKAAASMAILGVALQLLIAPILILAAGNLISESAMATALGQITKLMVILGLIFGGLAFILTRNNMNPRQISSIGTVLLSISGAIAIFAGALLLLAPAIVILAAAGVIFASFLGMMDERMFEKFQAGLERLGNVADAISKFGAALAIFGFGAILAGAGIGTFAIGAGVLLLALSGLIWVFPKFVDTLAQLKELSSGDLLKSMGKVALIMGGVAVAIGVLVLSLGGLFNLLTGKRFASFGIRISTLIGQIGDSVVSSGKSSISKIAAFLRDPENKQIILTAINTLIITVGLYLLGVIPTLTDTLFQAIVVLIDSLANAVVENKDAFVGSLTKMVKALLDVVTELIGSLFSSEFLKSLNLGEILLGVLGVLLLINKVVGAMNIMKPFGNLSNLLTGGKGAAAGEGGLIGSLTKAKKGILGMIEAAGGFGAVLPVVIALAAALGYASENLKDQQNILRENAGDPKTLEEYANSIAQVEARIAELTEQEKNGLGTELSSQELQAQSLLLSTLKKEYEELQATMSDTPVEETRDYITELRSMKAAADAVNDSREKAGAMTAYKEALERDAAAMGMTAEALQAVVEGYNEVETKTEEAKATTTSGISELTEKATEMKNTLTSGLGENTTLDAARAKLKEIKDEIGGTEFGSMFANMFDMMDLESMGKTELEATSLTLKTIAENIPGGIGEGILSKIGDVTTALTGLSDESADTFASENGIESPSTRYAELAKWIPAGIGEGIKNYQNTAISPMYGLIRNLENTFAISRGRFRSFGTAVVSGLVNGISENMVHAYRSGQNLAVSLENGFRNRLLIRSPSRVFADLAKYIPQGIEQGVESESGTAIDSIVVLGDALIDAVMRSMSMVSTVASDEFSIMPQITPIVNMDNVNMAAGAMRGMFGSQSVGKLFGQISAQQAERYASVSASYISDSSAVLEEMQSMGKRIDALGEAITNMQIVLDSGTLVGATSAKMDARLGVLAARKGRGN